MGKIFETLPGLEVPVGGIAQGFDQLWTDTAIKDQKAMQLNLVLHYGLETTPEDALAQFRVAVRLAQRYPCRVVVLCPIRKDTGTMDLRAKIYGECFLGKSKDDTRCIETVALSYPLAARDYLQDQVSVCLSTDLPIYYWPHRFISSQRLSAYDYLLTRSERVIFDSAIVASDALTYAWPKLSGVRDLAYTRTLPLRQNIAQFISRYAPALIIEGLRQVTITHGEDGGAEAGCLLGWVKKGLVRAGLDPATAPAFAVGPGSCASSFRLEFTYADPKKTFQWTANLAGDQADFIGDLGLGRSTQTVAAHFLKPEAALAEAMFF